MDTKDDFDKWIDRSIARLMKLTNSPVYSDTSDLQPDPENKKHNTDKNEDLMQEWERDQLKGYFERLRKAIDNYEEYILHGPSDVKNELINLIRGNYHIENIKIEVKPSDKKTRIHQHVFEKELYCKTG
jgi:stalled ribosome rescue protein Dom34